MSLVRVADIPQGSLVLAGALAAAVVLVLVLAPEDSGLLLVLAVVWGGGLLGGLLYRWWWLLVYAGAYGLGSVGYALVVAAFGGVEPSQFTGLVLLVWLVGLIPALPLAALGAGVHDLVAWVVRQGRR